MPVISKLQNLQSGTYIQYATYSSCMYVLHLLFNSLEALSSARELVHSELQHTLSGNSFLLYACIFKKVANVTKVIRNWSQLGFRHLANTSTVEIPVGVYLQPAAPKHLCNLSLFVPKRIFCWNTANTLVWFIKLMYTLGFIPTGELREFRHHKTIPTVWPRDKGAGSKNFAYKHEGRHRQPDLWQHASMHHCCEVQEFCSR